MKALITFTFLVICVVFSAGDDLLANEQCEDDPEGYIVPDPIYCDRYMECDPGAIKSIKICPLSEKFDFETASCVHESRVDCGTRTKTWNVDPVAKRIKIKTFEEEPDEENLDILSSPFSSGNNPRITSFESFPGGVSSPTPVPTLITTVSTVEPTLSETVDSSPPRSSTSEVAIPNDPLGEIACDGDDEYVVPDPSHCDRFLSCPSQEIELCDEGFTMDLDTGFCEPRESVQCEERHLNFRDNQIELERRLAEKISLLNLGSTASKTASNVGTNTLKESKEPNTFTVFSALPVDSAFGTSQQQISDTILADQNTQSSSNIRQNLAQTIAQNSVPTFNPSGVSHPHTTSNLHAETIAQSNIEIGPSNQASHLDQRGSSEESFFGSRTEIVEPSKQLNFDVREPSPSQTVSSGGSNTLKELRKFAAETNQRQLSDTISATRIHNTPVPSNLRQSVLNLASSIQLNSAPKVVANRESVPLSHTHHTGFDQGVQATRDFISSSNTRASVDHGSFDLRGSSNEDDVEDIGLSVDDIECELKNENYRIADGEQCDKYAVCNHGTKTVLLCPDGKAFSLHNSRCDLLSKVDCEGRPKLQPAKSTSLCPRENGFFPFPAEHSCEKYIDCRNGVGRVLSCGAGAVFDEKLFCVHPDQTKRPGCSAQDKYQFTCPSSGLTQRFGDHDRLPHPTDCSFFYACLSNGAPRLLSCQKPTVFNPVTGFCEHQDKVPGCEGFYTLDEEQLSVEAREKLAQEIRDQILREFNLAKRK